MHISKSEKNLKSSHLTSFCEDSEIDELLSPYGSLNDPGHLFKRLYGAPLGSRSDTQEIISFRLLL